MKLSLVCLFLGFCVIQPIKTANILFFFQLATYSHRITVWPLAEALAEKGHNVTFHTIFQPKDPNPKIREFFPKSMEKIIIEEKAKNDSDVPGDFLASRIQNGRPDMGIMAFFALPKAAIKLCQAFLDAPETDEFIKKENFDLVVIDALFNDCGYGIAHRFKAKTMLFGTTHPFPWTQEALGAVQDTSVFSELHTSFQIPMTFFEKVLSTLLVPATYYLLKTWFFYPHLDSMFQKRFNDPNIPGIAQLERQVSLVLYNSHFSEEEARALPPMFVPIGGLHCDWAKGLTKSKPIPKEIAKFINDTAAEGFIYVSFGSEAKLGGTSLEFQNIFYTAFRNAGIRFLWKWEGERPKEMPENVLTAEWMPQQEILKSEKCRGFITHGGLLSIQEALSSAVPMITLPIFAEQDFNSFRLERTGRGIKLELSTLTTKQLQHAIHQILTNPIFKENLEEASKMFKDRPQLPIETAVFWTEFVLRHNQTSALKLTHAMEEFWFQRRLLDIWAFFFISIFALFCTTYFIFRKMIIRPCVNIFNLVVTKRAKLKKS